MMKASLNCLLIALMLWLPLSQAAALCCPVEQPMPEQQMMSAMPDCDQHAADEAMGTHSADCQGDCLQLTQVVVPALAALLDPATPDARLPYGLPRRLLPGHQHPPLRPPRDLS